MKLVNKVLIVIFLSVTSAPNSWGCEFTTDCYPGSQCIKSFGSLYGVCEGGTQPGNDNDSQPVTGMFHSETGSTCSSDLSCGVGQTCVKSISSISGVCE